MPLSRARLRSLSAAAVLLTVAMAACQREDDRDSSACAPLPSPAPTGDTGWRGRLDEEALERYPARYPETFAGVWLDDRRRRAIIAFTDEPARHRARIRRLAKNPELIEVVRRGQSRQALTRRADRISEDKEALARRGITLSSVGVDDRSGRVVVGVAGSDAADAEYLCTLYGANIIVQRETIPSPLRRATPPTQPSQLDRSE